MSTPEFMKPGVRPSSPAATVWFEFLLRPDLLIQHLNKPHAIPGANQLIVQFLQQANTLESGSQGNDAKQNPGDNGTKEQQQTPVSKEELKGNNGTDGKMVHHHFNNRVIYNSIILHMHK